MCRGELGKRVLSNQELRAGCALRARARLPFLLAGQLLTSVRRLPAAPAPAGSYGTHPTLLPRRKLFQRTRRRSR